MLPKSKDIIFVNSRVYDDSALIQLATYFDCDSASNDDLLIIIHNGQKIEEILDSFFSMEFSLKSDAELSFLALLVHYQLVLL